MCSDAHSWCLDWQVLTGDWFHDRKDGEYGWTLQLSDGPGRCCATGYCFDDWQTALKSIGNETAALRESKGNPIYGLRGGFMPCENSSSCASGYCLHPEGSDSICADVLVNLPSGGVCVDDYQCQTKKCKEDNAKGDKKCV